MDDVTLDRYHFVGQQYLHQLRILNSWSPSS